VEEAAVLDIVYIGITVMFFGVMIAYVRGCEALGRDAASEESPS
jgi:hypothetical protein